MQEKNLLIETLHEKERRIETLEGKFQTLHGEVGSLRELLERLWFITNQKKLMAS